MHIFNLIDHIDVLASTYVNGRLKSFGVDGPPGCGKTQVLVTEFADAWARFTGKPVSVVLEILSMREATDIAGLPLLDKSDPEHPAYRYGRPDIFRRVMDAEHFEDGYVLLVLDEFTQCSQDMQKVVSDLIQNGRTGEYTLPPNVWVVATGNRLSDGAGVTRQLSMLTNRMVWYHVTMPIKHWANYAQRIDLPPLAIAFAQRFPDIFADKVPPREGAFCTNRSYTEFSQYLKAYNQVRSLPAIHVPDAENVWAMNTACGMVGEDVARRFFAFSKIADQLPTEEEILRNPHTARVPEDWQIDAQYAAMNLAVSVGKKGFLELAPAVKYLLRLPLKELHVAGMMALHNHPTTRGIAMNNPDFSVWMQHNTALIADSYL